MDSGISDIIEFDMISRSCECCNGNDFEPVYSKQSIVTNFEITYRFRVHVVVCRKCGFCFTSPSPTAEDLHRYYTNSLTHYKENGLPYSIGKRISTLQKYQSKQGIFVEIGGDKPKEFHRQCRKLFGTLIDVDVSSEIPSDLRRINDIKPDSVDVIAHYDVLEHVPNVRNFLLSCQKALKENGIMICEVPDIRLYPRNLLLAEFEHVNHFSINTLTAIAQICGFKLLEIGHICSRPFGLLVVFCKDSSQTVSNLYLPFEYLDALSCVKGGIEQIDRVQKCIKDIQKRITGLDNKGKKITLWGVTDFLRHLLDDFSLPNSAVVVDLDPRRKIHLQNYNVEVFQPKDKIRHIQNSKLLVIFAPRYKAEIVEWVHEKMGKQFKSSQLVVIGTGPSGESLN